MVKPAKTSSEVSKVRTRGIIKAHKLLRHCKKRAQLKQWRRAVNQPVAGTAKAGGTGSDQNQDQARGSPDVGMEDFLETGRTGRRNAMPDIADEKDGQVSTAGLPADLGKLSCTDAGGSNATDQAAKPSS